MFGHCASYSYFLGHGGIRTFQTLADQDSLSSDSDSLSGDKIEVQERLKSWKILLSNKIAFQKVIGNNDPQPSSIWCTSLLHR